MVFDNVNYAYNDGVSSYQITYKGYNFLGLAECHNDDMDFANERVGLTIAEARAVIKVLRFMRDTELVPQIKILKHLYSNIETSQFHNPKSHESRRIRSQIRALERALESVNNAIADEKKFIKDYIDGKDKLYKRLRAKNQ